MSKAGVTGMTKILTYLRDFFAEKAKTVFSINNELPDENGNVDLSVVPAAQQLVTDEAQTSEATFISRTTGGETSIGDGTAVMMQLRGNNVHTGIVEEVLTMSLVTATREEGVDPITAELDEDTFRAYVADSGTTTLLYTTEWSEDPTLYGVTVTGDPMAGDTITITYVKGDRGTIAVPTPTAFRSTGYNLYDHTNGYAYVKKYSTTYGFLVAGTYTSLAFSETVDGARTTIEPASGYFNVSGDGYVWVTGGNDTDTEIYMTWSDWINGRDCSWAAYTEDTIDLSTIMSNCFANGMCKVGSTYDEIDLNAGLAIQRIERLAYSDENLAQVISEGRAYDADENYIYAVLDTYVQTSVTVDGSYTANDHGLEIFDDTSTAATMTVIYGENLVDKLRTDVLTKSADLVNNLTSGGTQKALTAEQGKVLNSNIANYREWTKLVDGVVFTSTGAIGSFNLTPYKEVLVVFDTRRASDNVSFSYKNSILLAYPAMLGGNGFTFAVPLVVGDFVKFFLNSGSLWVTEIGVLPSSANAFMVWVYAR